MSMTPDELTELAHATYDHHCDQLIKVAARKLNFQGGPVRGEKALRAVLVSWNELAPELKEAWKETVTFVVMKGRHEQ